MIFNMNGHSNDVMVNVNFFDNAWQKSMYLLSKHNSVQFITSHEMAGRDCLCF